MGQPVVDSFNGKSAILIGRNVLDQAHRVSEGLMQRGTG
jgi:hypothetical protein